MNINLEDFRTGKTRVFVGMENGRGVRELTKIDDCYEDITITIPEDICSINPSFLEGFLEGLITRYGRRDFGKRVKFINEGHYKVELDIAETICRVNRQNRYKV